ncbi:MAG: Tyrosine-specific transport protein [Chlamydiae bacterium]|nr:Tyrosine-specific transport protein [Chlamydiota bacterium]
MKELIKSRLLGGILLICGTTLGVGMLGFPTVTSFGGFFPSLLIFFVLWLLMLISAFLFLDVNLSMEGKTNMVTMAERTLGTWGRVVSWIVYLLLLYSLTAAYISGCTPLIVQAVKWATGYTLPGWFAPFSLPILFAGFIYFGTRGVDLVNRLLMIGLVLSYALLIFFLPAEVQPKLLEHFDMSASILAVPVVVTAFGYHIIIPSLSVYMKRDRRAMRRAIIIGSLISIAVYLLWQVLILGTVPIPMLANAYKEGVAATEPLSQVVRNPLISLGAKLFSFFAIVTSFVGVTLSLSDFLTDGFKIKQNGQGRFLALLLTFIPPLFFVFTYSRGFYLALEYAGAFVAILLIFLPAAMAWKLKKHRFYASGKGKLFLTAVILLAFAVVALDILQERGTLNALIEPYRK